MPILSRLSDAGFHIWPFDDPALPLIVEIYPRLLTGPVRKSKASARAGHLTNVRRSIAEPLRRLAASSEDAFDAAVSALVMDEHQYGLTMQKRAEDETTRLEGRIWWPDAPLSSAEETSDALRGSSG